MLSEARLKKYRNIKEGPKKLNFGASKPGVGGGGSHIRDWLILIKEISAGVNCWDSATLPQAQVYTGVTEYFDPLISGEMPSYHG